MGILPRLKPRFPPYRNTMTKIVLKKGRERSLLRRHPWVFSGAIERVEGTPGPGDTVEVLSNDRTFLARGAFSPHSQILVRTWSFDPEEAVDRGFFHRRLQAAIRRRPEALAPQGACRLVYGESDGLPGLVVDRYGDHLVCQFLSSGAEAWRDEILGLLPECVCCKGLYERSDSEVCRKEGLPERTGPLWGEPPPDFLEVAEGPLCLLVDIGQGHKTGLYLDQSRNRVEVGALASGREVLDAFSYAGGFGCHALAGGATRVVQVETSGRFLEIGRRTLERNGLDSTRCEDIQGDAFKVLRGMRDRGRRFDMVVLDPPKFAASQGQVPAAARGYKDIALLAFKLLEPGGLLLTFSCSGAMEEALFQKIVADAALDAGKEAQILRRLTQGQDHPTLLSFPEATYLKGFLCRVLP